MFEPVSATTYWHDMIKVRHFVGLVASHQLLARGRSHHGWFPIGYADALLSEVPTEGLALVHGSQAYRIGRLVPADGKAADYYALTVMAVDAERASVRQHLTQFAETHLLCLPPTVRALAHTEMDRARNETTVAT